jgi:2-dehydro-3-deoxyphosphogluconate aldolase/(4S)-4-hydroxy-2-oxoglutarate aldolase
MDKAAVLKSLQDIGLVPVLRAESVEQALTLAGAIADGGVTVLEITMTVPGAIQVMRKLAEQRPDILIGAGTVLDAETARMCILEGAQFVVSPALNLDTITMRFAGHCERLFGRRCVRARCGVGPRGRKGRCGRQTRGRH